MSDSRTNLHGTAIRINDLGILCVGASGSGKSELAFSLLEEAKRWGASTALIADDQIFLSIKDNTIIASRPHSTADMIELRGSGIIQIESEADVTLTYVVTRELSAENERLPPQTELYHFGANHSLPLIRIPIHSLTPYARFNAFVGHLCRHGAFELK